jgi:predicted N-acetyltransferase YhbS
MMITIDLLKNHPERVQRCAEIWHQVLGRIWLPDLPLEHVVQRFSNHLNEHELPLTVVAFQDNKLIGMCSLRENDGIRPGTTPWLGSLAVDPDYQKKGIGRMLINSTKNKAKEMGFGKLYLFAFDPALPDYYTRLGWVKIGMDEFKRHSVTVMSTVL